MKAVKKIASLIVALSLMLGTVPLLCAAAEGSTAVNLAAADFAVGLSEDVPLKAQNRMLTPTTLLKIYPDPSDPAAAVTIVDNGVVQETTAGPGWKYSTNSGHLWLDAYSGGGLEAVGMDVTVVLLGNNTITTGASGPDAAISVQGGNLHIRDNSGGRGKLRVNAQGSVSNGILCDSGDITLDPCVLSVQGGGLQGSAVRAESGTVEVYNTDLTLQANGAPAISAPGQDSVAFHYTDARSVYEGDTAPGTLIEGDDARPTLSFDGTDTASSPYVRVDMGASHRDKGSIWLYESKDSDIRTYVLFNGDPSYLEPNDRIATSGEGWYFEAPNTLTLTNFNGGRIGTDSTDLELFVVVSDSGMGHASITTENSDANPGSETAIYVHGRLTLNLGVNTDFMARVTSPSTNWSTPPRAIVARGGIEVRHHKTATFQEVGPYGMPVSCDQWSITTDLDAEITYTRSVVMATTPASAPTSGLNPIKPPRSDRSKDSASSGIQSSGSGSSLPPEELPPQELSVDNFPFIEEEVDLIGEMCLEGCTCVDGHLYNGGGYTPPPKKSIIVEELVVKDETEEEPERSFWEDLWNAFKFWQKTTATTREIGATGETTPLNQKATAGEQVTTGSRKVFRELPTVEYRDGVAYDSLGLRMSTMRGKSVEVRLTIPHPSRLEPYTMLSGWTQGRSVKQAYDKLHKHFSNRIAVIHMDEPKGWNQDVAIAAKVDLEFFDTDNLVLYAYNIKTNKYRKLSDQSYRIDANGYLRFKTFYGGDIIVSEGAFVSR